MLTVYRTVKAKYATDPLATEGARLFGGRWNPKGFPLLYSTSSPELALVESLVHQPRVKYEKLPNLLLFTLAVPVELTPDAVTTYPLEDLPDYWTDESYERTQWILRDWLVNPTTLVAAVTSVAVPMSVNYLLHPGHPLFGEIRVMRQIGSPLRPFPIERRLWRDEDKASSATN